MTGTEMKERRQALAMTTKDLADRVGEPESLIIANEDHVGVMQGGLAQRVDAILSSLEEARNKP
ncbi:hypothetical protein J0H33_05955 [bacterium]|nr:hypothetical protein [bacterium]